MNCVICQLQRLCNRVFQNKGLFIKAPIFLKFGPANWILIDDPDWELYEVSIKWGINETPSLFDRTYYIYKVALARSLCANLGRTTTGYEWLFSLQTFLISAHPHPQQILSKSLINGGDTCPPKNDGRPSARVSKIAECLVGYGTFDYDSYTTWTRFKVGKLISGSFKN